MTNEYQGSGKWLRIRAYQKNFLELLLPGDGDRQFLVPVYQRPYSWKREQIEQLFADVTKLCEKMAEDQEWEHFLGTIVLIPQELKFRHEQYLIVDGQQRLTSLYILLIALLEASREKKFRAQMVKLLVQEVISDNEIKLRLQLQNDDDKYLNFFTNAYRKYYAADEGTTRNLVAKAFRAFQTHLRRSHFTIEQIFSALENVNFVVIELDKNKAYENPQDVFESINATGLNLSSSDMVRNFLLMSKSLDEQTQYYEKYWLELIKLCTKTLESGREKSTLDEFLREFAMRELKHRKLLERERTLRKDEVYFYIKKLYFSVLDANLTEEDFWNLMIDAAKIYGSETESGAHTDKPQNAKPKVRKIQTKLGKSGTRYYFDNEINFTGRTPEGVWLQDNAVWIGSWREFWKILVHIVYQNSTEKFFADCFQSDNWTAGAGQTKRYLFDSTYNEMRDFIQIDEDLYTEGALTIPQIMRYSRRLLEHFDYLEDVTFTIEAGVNTKLMRRRRTMRSRYR
ncbi:MAG: DUF262 domain-containing protein [Candidatus Ancillula sp.]|jgi:hypothetical protein|nr:DUF262 domain-containing protein [Candidatus Ancillula sp.]